MDPNKDNIVAAIGRARVELDQALEELARLPAFETGAVGLSTHALNNYLTVAQGVLGLLSAALNCYPDADVRNWLQSLHQVTGLMDHTVGQLMGRSLGGPPRLVFASCDLTTGLRRACAFYQRIADRKQIRILCEPADDIPFIWTDHVVVAAVLDNLLSNAVKYSARGGRVWVRLQPAPESVVVSVQDEGQGISLEEQGKLFQKGVRLSPLPTDGEPSTGFGLAVAKELVDQLRGEIWCKSAPGQGACFSFRLPIGKPAAELSPTHPGRSGQG
jgi:signal transduction histidine kinase